MIAMLPAAVGDLDRLGVKDARTGFSGASKPFTKVSSKLSVHLLEDPVLAPASKIVIHGSPRRKIVRKHPPGTATSQDVEDRIDNLPATDTRGAGRNSAGQGSAG